MSRAMLAVIAALAPGCATMMDVAFMLHGPNGHGSRPGSAIGIGRSEVSREIVVDGHGGLACRDIETPWVRTAQIDTHVTDPNGFKAGMQVVTLLEGTILGVLAAVIERKCATEGCDASSTQRLLTYAPFTADVAWGVYRSVTIHNEILRSSDVGWNAASPTIPTVTQASRCAEGTEIPLYAGTDHLTVHVGADGFTVAAELGVLVDFIAAHQAFAVGGANVKLDASRASQLVANLRPPPPPVATATMRPAPTVPVTYPTGVRIDVDLTLPRPRQR